MNNEIYLIEKYWEMPSGKTTWGYEPCGYVDTDDISNLSFTKEVIIGTGWPIAKGHKIPKYRVTKICRMN